MEGIHYINENGNTVFIPAKAIDKVVIKPEEEYKEIKQPWLKSIFYSCHEWVETGRWELHIETNGRNNGCIIYDTKQEAEQKLKEIESMKME
jgi:hypothetical protein